MRITALAGFSFAALLGCTAALNASEEGWSLRGGSNFSAGLGAVVGSTGPQALYIQGAEAKGHNKYYMGTLEREFPVKALQGQRVRLSLRLKNDGVASTMVALYVSRGNGEGIRAPASYHWQTDDEAAWRVKEFVVDVPADAQTLALQVNVKDKAKVWVDELKLEAVGRDVALTSSGRTLVRLASDARWGEGSGASANSSNLAPDPSAYAPLIGGSFVVGGTPVTMPGQTPR